MLSRFHDLDRSLAWMDAWRRRMDRAFGEVDRFRALADWDEPWALSDATWPRVNVRETNAAVIVEADVPGMTEKDLQIQLHQDVLTLSGQRKIAAPEGFTAHRKERASAQFSRSFALPAKVNAERSVATLRDGVLTIEIAKAEEVKPRQIAIRGA